MTDTFSPPVRLWSIWILVTAIGSTCGYAIISIFTYYDNYFSQLSFLVIIITGILIGYRQRAMLRSGFKETQIWLCIPAITIGLPLGLVTILSIWFFTHSHLTFLLPYDYQIVVIFSSSITGIFAGTLQWFVLHKQLKGLFGWILVSAWSWAIGLALSFFLYESYISSLTNEYVQISIFGALVGIIAGAISGYFMKSMLMYPEL